MGADLYIKSMDRKAQCTGFRTDLNVGYFRDSYNSWNLLWQFGLDYWVTIAKQYVGKGGLMSPAKAKKLLKTLQDREPVFEKNLEDLRNGKNKVWDYRTTTSKGGFKHLKRPVLETDKDLDRADAEKYYRDHYEELKGFLNKAIDLNSAVECSL